MPMYWCEVTCYDCCNIPSSLALSYIYTGIVAIAISSLSNPPVHYSSNALAERPVTPSFVRHLLVSRNPFKLSVCLVATRLCNWRINVLNKAFLIRTLSVKRWALCLLDLRPSHWQRDASAECCKSDHSKLCTFISFNGSNYVLHKAPNLSDSSRTRY